MTVDGTTIVIVLAVVVAWLVTLTAGQLRSRRYADEPVYRRLPNGRIRFEWSVGTAYHAARRAAVPHAGPGPVDTPRPTGSGPPTSDARHRDRRSADERS